MVGVLLTITYMQDFLCLMGWISTESLGYGKTGFFEEHFKAICLQRYMKIIKKKR
jgi:hypothetical protein